MASRFAVALLLASSLALAGVLCAIFVVFLPEDSTSSATTPNEGPFDNDDAAGASSPVGVTVDWGFPGTLSTQDYCPLRNSKVIPCAPRTFKSDAIVCVCNSSYCDTIEELSMPPPGQVISYTTTKSGKRFERKNISFQQDSTSTAGLSFTITNIMRQTIKGFGGAFTDAAGINILTLSPPVQELLLKSYFSPQGIEYNIGRIPMASCDFSTRLYTYADQPNDFDMKNFSLADEDFRYKIPIIKKAMEMNRRGMSLFGSPWSAPAWMKTNNALFGKGSLLGKAGDKYHQAWALYFARFLEEYERNGVSIWGLTAQNEPRDGNAPDFDFQCMGFTAEEQRDFVKLDLGPKLQSRGHSHVKLMIGDDQRQVLPQWADVVLGDADAAQYVAGIAVHWYMDFVTSPSRLTSTHQSHPDYFILGTEACTGAMPWTSDEDQVDLGSWVRGQRYSQDILGDLNNWAVGWVDWNLVLDMQGGPNWVKNFVDAPIIANSKEDEFYKQPMFYHMGHFSKFIPENSIYLEVSGTGLSGNLKHAGFLHPDGVSVSFIILNTAEVAVKATIKDMTEGSVTVDIPAKSIQTYVWSRSFL